MSENIDWNWKNLRDSEIERIKLEFPDLDVSFFDKEFNFFYDETNNIRKLYLKENGECNIENLNSNFVLGGLLFKKEPCWNFAELREEFLLQNTIKEIKIKNICGKGVDFLNALKSDRLTKFLKKILDHEVYVHYSVMNFLYWSLVDIIDSLINFDEWFTLMRLYYRLQSRLDGIIASNNLYTFDEFCMMSIYALKDEIYYAVLKNLNEVQFLFARYKYPNVDKEKIEEFIKELLKIIKIESLKDTEFPYLKIFFNRFGNRKEAPFITEEKDYVLLDSFEVFYIRNVYLFCNSKHILDKEGRIQQAIRKYNLLYGICYKFEDSKTNLFIQLSDVFVGLIGKMYDFLSNISASDLYKLSLNTKQNYNLKLLIESLQKTQLVCPGLFHSVLPLSIKKKESLLLEKI